MATGTLVTESMVVGAGLHGLDVVLRGIERVEAEDLSDGQRAAGIPDRWTLLRFDVDDGKATGPRRSPARAYGVPKAAGGLCSADGRHAA